MKYLFYLTFFFVCTCHAKKLNWATLDEKTAEGKPLVGFRAGAINDSMLDPNPNSTRSLRNRIIVTFEDEQLIWDGVLAGEFNPVPTYTYLKTMANITTVIADFIRTAYGSIFQDLNLASCNSIVNPPEVILASDLGLGPNTILLNATELDLLIPQHTCRLPRTSLLPLGPTFDAIRKFMPEYKTYLGELDIFLECILLYNAFPYYTKGVNCLEDYYFGEQDAGANPAFFDLMAHKQSFKNAATSFGAIPMPLDVTLIGATTWTDLQYELEIARQYKEIARKLRYTSTLIYNAVARNYARLHRIKSCRTLEENVYQDSGNVTRFWCEFQNCYSDSHNFSLVGQTFTTGHPLEPQQATICENSTCGLTDTFPDPFYCDLDRDCPNAWFCSLVDRHCYKKEQRANFFRSYNSTICGYPRKLADASVVDGSVLTAFGGNVNESAFWFATYWPQNCSTNVDQVVDISQPFNYGPVTFTQVCYPFNATATPSAFFSNGTTNCNILDPANVCFVDIEYVVYLDGVAFDTVLETVCITRTPQGDETWQVEHCSSTGPMPQLFNDSNAYDSNITGIAYMDCAQMDPGCVTYNTTHACFNDVQDVIQVYDRFITSETTSCQDLRIYGSPANITYGYVDPNASAFPPAPENVPPGYINSTYFRITAFQYLQVTGTYTTTEGSVPFLLVEPEYAEVVGFYAVQTSTAPFVYKITGQVTFYQNCVSPTSCANRTRIHGVDYFVSTIQPATFSYLPTLSIDNTTGVVQFNPLENAHPNPRFDDPDECFFLQVSTLANIPMTQSPFPESTKFKDFWLADVGPRNDPENSTPRLYPCAAIFLRKTLYVQNPSWLESEATDYDQGIVDGDLRYVCQRSLEMSATCARFGIPMTSSEYTTILSSVNPPTDNIVFLL